MAALYELVGDYKQLLDMLEDPDEERESIIDTLEGISGEIDDKAENIGKLIRTLTAEAAALKAEEERLHNRRQSAENRAAYLKEYLFNAMRETGKSKIKTALFSFTIQKNPASVVLDVPAGSLPTEFLTPREPSVDKAAIRKAIESGRDLAGYAHLERSESLRVR